MADPIFFGLFDASGAPAAAAVPTWVSGVIYGHGDAVTRAAPAFVNRGEGQHGFEPSEVDEAIGCVGLIDAGVGAYFASGSRYAAVTIPEAAQFEALVLTDAAGALWTGAAPTITSYEGRSGALTPATILSITTALHTFAPSAADIAAGVSYRLDSPANAYPAFFFGSATAPTVGPYTPPSSGVYPADAVAQLLAGVITLPDPPGGDAVTLTYGANGNLLLGPVRPVGEGVMPRVAVFVLQNGGPAPAPYMGQAESWHQTRVQVTVRGAIGAYDVAHALARALHARAHLNTPPGYTFSLAQESDPSYLGLDDEGAHRFVFNLSVGHRR